MGEGMLLAEMNKRHLTGGALAMLTVLAGFPSVVSRAQREAPALTPEQIQALVMRVIENQHRDDQHLEQYEIRFVVIDRADVLDRERRKVLTALLVVLATGEEPPPASIPVGVEFFDLAQAAEARERTH